MCYASVFSNYSVSTRVPQEKYNADVYDILYMEKGITKVEHLQCHGGKVIVS
jgi:hypothetical protein